MIKNERQYQITRRQMENFEIALQNLALQLDQDTSVHPRLRRAEQEGLQSQLDDLKTELREYEELKNGLQPVLQLQSIEKLSEALIKARIAAGWSQEDLADKLGMKHQQVQRYEATDYSGASLSTLGTIARTLGVGIQENVLLPTADATSAFFFRRLARLGIDPLVVRQRVLPVQLRAVLDAANSGVGEPIASAVLQSASIVGRVFGLDPMTILGSTLPRLDLGAVASARFKTPARINEPRLDSYAIYANYISQLVLKATPDLSPQTVPTDPIAIHSDLVSRYGSIDFRGVLDFVWELGIPVVPLSDRGAFHGAVWRTEGRNVIVLKQNTRSAARWLIDLLHELYHAAEEPLNPDLTVVEMAEDADERRSSDDEWEATEFAGQIALGGRAEELAEVCARESHMRAPLLKSTVERVARREGVNVGVLANYLAYRLAFEEPPINWWGAASNLQSDDEDPWLIARDVLLTRLDFSRLDPLDRDLLSRALDNPEE